jgi:peptidoglycan-N-acetylglucosamine deacetylase
MQNATEALRTFTLWIVLTSIFLGAALWLPGWKMAVRSAASSERKLALTLDDGPNPPYTEKFLQLLEHHQIPATFFFIGRNIEFHRASAQKVVDSGMEVGNHSYSHTRLQWKMPSQLAFEIEHTHSLIRSLGYQGPIPFRAPYGQWGGFLGLWLFFRSLPNILYDVPPTPADYFRADPAAIAESSSLRARGGSILLLHDGEGIRIESLEAADRLIRTLKAKGFQWVRLSELLTLR